MARRAVSALDGGALAPPGPETSEKLASKHPPKRWPAEYVDLVSLPSARVELITEAIVESAILSFRKGTANRGLRAQHLRDALNSEAKAQFLTQITRLIRFLAEGKVPSLFAPFLAGASLIALDKTKNDVFDVRPIASGEILRRLVSKCLCATQREKAGKHFVAGGQYGVCCPSGVERVTHMVRVKVAKVVKDHEDSCRDSGDRIAPTLDFVILKVDLKNAFNKVSRKHMLKLHP